MENISDVSFERITSSEYMKPIRMHYKQNGKIRKWDLMRVHDSVAILLYHRTRNSLIFVKQFRPAVYLNRIDVIDNDYSKIDFSKYPASRGCTYEMCAGIVDKQKTLKEIAQEEIIEECGYHVELDNIEKITTCRNSKSMCSFYLTSQYSRLYASRQIINLHIDPGNTYNGAIILTFTRTRPLDVPNSGVGVTGALQTMYYAEVDESMQISEGGGNEHEQEMIDVIYIPVDKCKSFIFDEEIQKGPGLMFAVMWFFENKYKKKQQLNSFI